MSLWIAFTALQSWIFFAQMKVLHLVFTKIKPTVEGHIGFAICGVSDLWWTKLIISSLAIMVHLPMILLTAPASSYSITMGHHFFQFAMSHLEFYWNWLGFQGINIHRRGGNLYRTYQSLPSWCTHYYQAFRHASEKPHMWYVFNIGVTYCGYNEF